MLGRAEDKLSGLDPGILFGPVRFEKSLGLAVSGGADSLGLLLLAAHWRQSGPCPDMIVYSLDHGLRQGSTDEVARVVALAESLGLPARGLTWAGGKPTSVIQAAARAVRYRQIGDAMAADGVKVLMTGHHLADQAETILMRMAHGSGISGLTGMRSFAQVEGITVFRPLLEVDPALLIRICAAHGLVPVNDPSNSDEGYERVKWRKASPWLADLGLSAERLSLLGRRLARVERLACVELDRFWAHHCAQDGFGVIQVDRAAFQAAQPETGIRVLRRALALTGRNVHGALAGIEALWEKIGDAAFSGSTLHGARIVVNGAALLVFREVGRMDRAPMRIVPGTPFVWDNRFVIETNLSGLRVEPAGRLSRRMAEELLGCRISLPMSALGGTALITDGAGEIVALGAAGFVSGINVRHRALT